MVVVSCSPWNFFPAAFFAVLLRILWFFSEEKKIAFPICLLCSWSRKTFFHVCRVEFRYRSVINGWNGKIFSAANEKQMAKIINWLIIRNVESRQRFVTAVVENIRTKAFSICGLMNFTNESLCCLLKNPGKHVWNKLIRQPSWTP